MRHRAAFTLLELMIALCVLGILLGAALPPMKRSLDSVAVRAARDELAAGVRSARAAARALGGARLLLDAPAARYAVVDAAGDTLAGPVDLAERHGVAVEASGVADTVALPFDGLGIGRVASRTIRVRRGAAVAGLTVSAYGRVRIP